MASKTEAKVKPTNTKDVLLNISERMAALRVLNDFKGNLDKLTFILDDLKSLSITDPEWKKANRSIVKTKNENGEESERWNWDNEKGGEKKIDLSEDAVDYMRNWIKEKNDKGEFSPADKDYISLKGKLL